MNKQEILDLILQGNEDFHIEFRESENWDDPNVQASVIKSILAMSHNPNGGVIVLGMKREEDHFIPQGIREEERKTFDARKMRKIVSTFADPLVTFKLKEVLQEGSSFLVIEVPQADSGPVICAKDGPGELCEGAIYVRTQKPFKTIRVKNSKAMRWVLDNAIEKSVRKLRLKLYRDYQESREAEKVEELPDAPSFDLPKDALPISEEDRLRLDKQTSSCVITGNPRMERILSRGYWRIIIRPTHYKKDKIKDMKECEAALKRNLVSIRGVGYPPMNSRETHTKEDYVKSSQDYMSLIYMWWFFQSAQLVHYIACREDYEIDNQNSEELNIPGSYPSENYFDVMGTLYLITEIYEFAAHMAYDGILTPSVEITLELMGMQNRQLFAWEPIWGFNQICICKENRIDFSKIYCSDELINNAHEHALDACMALFKNFNESGISKDILRLKQKQFLRLEI